MPSVIYAECHMQAFYAEYHVHKPFMLSVIMMNVIMLNVIMLSSVAPIFKSKIFSVQFWLYITISVIFIGSWMCYASIVVQ